MNIADLYVSLGWMWQGMLALFACMGVIALVTVLINKLIKPKEEKET
jgi:hypothetical protein